MAACRRAYSGGCADGKRRARRRGDGYDHRWDANRGASSQLAQFPAPERLQSADGALFTQTRESGSPRWITPGNENGPKLRFGMLEQSNVSIVESMMQILTAQRAYEANAKGIQAADEMLRIANNLQRG